MLLAAGFQMRSKDVMYVANAKVVDFYKLLTLINNTANATSNVANAVTSTNIAAKTRWFKTERHDFNAMIRRLRSEFPVGVSSIADATAHAAQPTHDRNHGRSTGCVFGKGAASISACSGSLSTCTASGGPIQSGSAR
jgi:hypothetical protein